MHVHVLTVIVSRLNTFLESTKQNAGTCFASLRNLEQAVNSEFKQLERRFESVNAELPKIAKGQQDLISVIDWSLKR